MLGRRSQQDFEDEIRSHLELETERLRAQGLSAADAERMARLRFGNVGVAEDRFYHAQRFASWQDSGRDIRHAWRALRRTPGFLVTCVVTLGLAIGAVTGMFAVVNSVIIKSLPFPNSDRLVAIEGTAPGSDMPERFPVGADFYLQYKERSKLIDGIFGFGGGTSTFRTENRVERIGMAWPTNDMYATLGVRPQLGRLPVPEDGDRVALISDQLWSSWFGRDPSVIGKSYFVSDTIRQIIGVMPPEFQIPSEQTMLWVATSIRLEDVRPGQGGMTMVARMKPGVTRDQLAAELTRLSKELPARFGGPPAYARLIEQHRAVVAPVLDRIVGPTARRSLWVLLGAVGVVLLIACANVANLFMVRAEGRTRDLAIRRAIGASRAQLVRLQMAEAIVVALAGGVLAVLLSKVTLPAFISAAPRLPRLASVRLDLPTLAAAFALVLITAVACGTVPALRASAPDFARLREGGRGNTGRRRRGRDVLVVGQTALALVLLIASALLVQSFNKLRNVDPGYRTQDLYTFQFAPERPYRDGPSWGRMHLDFMDRLRALPGVTGVGIVNNIPLDEGTPTVRFRTDDTPSSDGGGMLLNLNFTGGDYFNVMGIKLLRGRTFTTSEAVTPNNSVIISRSTADQLWPNQNPLGRIVRPRFGNQDTLAFTVVGVVADVKQDDWRQAGEATVYFPLTGPAPTAWAMTSPAYVVKSSRADRLTSEVRELVRQIAPEAPVYREFTMAFLAKRSMQQLSFTMLTLGVVAGLALLLGAIGLYGVLSYVVAERTREIGVRMALGATASAVRRMVVSQGARVVVVGAIIGVAVALASTRVLGSLLFGVKPVDPIVFAAMSAMMVAIGGLASYIPARRASSVNPIESLRSD
ncbi:MAG TPA: ABC transporter permease [Gemmatimonadaceae bacterium]|jgi:predicted permease|nr:ABC transporter permease [Gemmatimonadaceae bacterium]